MPQYHNDLTLSRFFKTKSHELPSLRRTKAFVTDAAMGHSDDSLQTWVDVPASVRGRLSHRHTLIHLSVGLTPQGQQPPDVQSNPQVRSLYCEIQDQIFMVPQEVTKIVDKLFRDLIHQQCGYRTLPSQSRREANRGR